MRVETTQWAGTSQLCLKACLQLLELEVACQGHLCIVVLPTSLLHQLEHLGHAGPLPVLHSQSPLESLFFIKSIPTCSSSLT